MENPYIVVEQKQEKKRRGALAILLAIAFCAILAIGSTFAYLTWTTNQTANRMTTNPNVTADLLEPAWTQAITTSGDNAAYGSDNVLIPKAANNMVPGSVVAKNPFVVNTTKVGDEATSGVDAYAGMKLQFQKWVSTTGGAGTGAAHDEGATGYWVNMTSNEVDTLLAVYGFSQKGASATPSTTSAGINNFDSGTSTGNPLGANWVQITDNKSYGCGTKDGTNAISAGQANQTGAMYFYNTEALIAESQAQAEAEAANTANDSQVTYDGTNIIGGTVANTDKSIISDTENWNNPYTYKSVTTAIPKDSTTDEGSGTTKAANYRTSSLFNSIRYVDGATQAQINALNNVLTNGAGTDTTNTSAADGKVIYNKVEYTKNANKTTDPGWRVVVSGAAIQAVKSTDGNSYTKQASDFKSSDTTDASANWVALLDATGTTDEKSSQKPKDPTGWRNTTNAGAKNADRKLGVNGIPNPSQINKDGKW